MNTQATQRAPTLKDRSWPLARALAWVMTRDVGRVAELQPQAELVELLMAKAFWESDGVPIFADPNAAWGQLASCIAAGDVEAHGRAFENNLKVGKREPIGATADGFALGDLHSQLIGFPGANLEDRHSTARIVDIVVRVRDLVAAFPADASGAVVAKSQGGRTPIYPWPEMEAHFLPLLDEHGAPHRDNERWRHKADLVREIVEFISDRHGNEPTWSLAKARVDALLVKFSALRASAT